MRDCASHGRQPLQYNHRRSIHREFLTFRGWYHPVHAFLRVLLDSPNVIPLIMFLEFKRHMPQRECEQTKHFARGTYNHCLSIHEPDRDSPVYHSWSEESSVKPRSQKDIRGALELDY